MAPSSSGRKYVVETHVSNADKTLDLGVDCGSGRETWRLEPDIGFARNLVSALPESAALTETPLISIQNLQFINFNCSHDLRTRNASDHVTD